MEKILQNCEGNLKMSNSESQKMTVCNTKRRPPISFRITPANEVRLAKLQERLKLNNRNMTLNWAIENIDIALEEKMRATQRCRETMAKYGIKKEDI